MICAGSNEVATEKRWSTGFSMLDGKEWDNVVASTFGGSYLDECQHLHTRERLHELLYLTLMTKT